MHEYKLYFLYYTLDNVQMYRTLAQIIIKEDSEMKTESEKKTKVTSIRLTEEQHQKVQEKAAKHNMKISNYLITKAVNNDEGLTPKIMVQVQDIANRATAIARQYAPEQIEEIESEVNKLWSQL